MLVVQRSWRDAILASSPGPKTKAISLALGAVLLWSTWPTLATWARPAPPFLIMSMGAAVGFGISLAKTSATAGVKAFFGRSLGTTLFVALALLMNNVLYLFAMPLIGPAEANVVSYLWPILLVLILSALHGKTLTRGQWIGILAAFSGAAIAIGPTFGHGFNPLGIGFALGSGLTFAVYAAIRSFAKDERDVVGPSMGIVAVICMGLHVAFEASTTLSTEQLLAIAAIGIAPLTLSNALWDRATRTGQAATISSLAYLTPLFGILILAVAGVASLTWATFLGAILIVLGALKASRH